MGDSFTVKVACKTRGAQEVCILELQRDDGGVLPSYTPGAHIDVHLPNGLVRQYSLTRFRKDPASYQIAVLREPDSRGGSLAVHESLNLGDTLQISAPRNLFPLAANAEQALLLAGGIGITPILCMADYLASEGRVFQLHYCGRSVERMAFLSELQDAGFSESVFIHTDDGPAEQRPAIEDWLRRASSGCHVYVCGPSGFIDAVIGATDRLGWSPDRVHLERFSNADSTLRAADGSFEVQLASSGRVIQVGAEESVAHALARHGVVIDMSCEQGICGTCLTGVLEGLPEHRDVYLSDDEKAANTQFTPCCSRSRSNRLVLDL